MTCFTGVSAAGIKCRRGLFCWNDFRIILSLFCHEKYEIGETCALAVVIRTVPEDDINTERDRNNKKHVVCRVKFVSDKNSMIFFTSILLVEN